MGSVSTDSERAGAAQLVSAQSAPAPQSAVVRFVDDHRAELIQRVTLVEPIADALKHLIQDEAYSNIRAARTSQEKMRVLYQALHSGGPVLKAAFYTALYQKEPHLVQHLGAV
ncbi:hypothetical protein MATL_G00219260 [Megalops atlanticus]|uniref:CARD domain-containing protein n=1 Tax=Megalops atlanticus TaxID=7932 RepID=A0A9D3PJ20_MEGAT|nr:hypothetical protein MATL_G00219260 [Megalops atlanticus]